MSHRGSQKRIEGDFKPLADYARLDSLRGSQKRIEGNYLNVVGILTTYILNDKGGSQKRIEGMIQYAYRPLVRNTIYHEDLKRELKAHYP